MSIAIERVLQHFDTTVDDLTQSVKTYGIKFITADGRVRTMHLRKMVKAPKQQLQQPLSARGGVQYNLKRNGTIMAEDIAQQEPRAIKVATVFSFRDCNSTTWQPVFH